MNSTHLTLTDIESLYSRALCLYPENFRLRYASAMRQSLRDALSDETPPQRNFIFLLARDLTTSLLKEHFSMLRETYLRPTLIFNALTLSAIATVLAIAIYVIPQQVLRQGANDPQIELAENLAQSLKSGTPLELALPTDGGNLAQNKSYFFVSSDGKGLPMPAADIAGKLPPPPPGSNQNIEIRVNKNQNSIAKGEQHTVTRTMTVTSDNSQEMTQQRKVFVTTLVSPDGKITSDVKVKGTPDAHAKTQQLNVQAHVDEIDGDRTPLTAGTTTLTETIPDDSIDLAHSLSPFLIAYDAQGNPIASQAKLNGKIPAPPKGVFENVRSKGEERLSWEPQPGTRFAAVILHVPASGDVKESFVLAGRSLREVEIREKQLGNLAFVNWLLMIGLILVGTVLFGWFTRPKIAGAAAV